MGRGKQYEREDLLDRAIELFRRQGFRVAAFAERSGVAQELRRNPADLVILDIGLGDESGAVFADNSHSECEWTLICGTRRPIYLVRDRS